MIFTNNPGPYYISEAVTEAYRRDETDCLNTLLPLAAFTPDAIKRIQENAAKWVKGTRKARKAQGGLDAFLHEYDLSSREGIALMCMAEALLRIPDAATVNKLIADKISTANWKKHLNKSDSIFVNFATLSLLLTGKLFEGANESQTSFKASLQRGLSKTSGAMLRPIIMQGMKLIGQQYVMGTTIEKALQRAKSYESKGYRYSYDMLGESAKTKHDAEKYFQSYLDATLAIGKDSNGKGPIKGPGISIKLSALHPRYEIAKRDRVLKELAPKLLQLAQTAKAQNIGLTVDAEEADRLELSLELIEKVFSDPSLAGWEGFGLAVQSYQKRAPFVIDWLAALAKKYQRRLMVRLIKGAYWDAEIKLAQLQGLSGYPVYTRKNSTDVSFLACAKKLLAAKDCFYPQFGTHNAYSAAAIFEIAGNNRDFEFQCLHGMGQTLYDQIVNENVACRIYAPVGTHKDLLGYLVRRLLENGANSSFINNIADETIPVEKIVADPVQRIANLTHKPHPYIPLPTYLFGQERLNSQGVDFSNMQTLNELKSAMEQFDHDQWTAGPILSGKLLTHGEKKTISSPSNLAKTVGICYEATAEDVEKALQNAEKAKQDWANKSVEERAACLNKAADLFEENTPRLMTLLTREAGKQLVDSVAEIREVVDFCRYYAARAIEDMKTITLPGPTGELNQLSLYPRGTIACISPWNFPLAIFGGQIVAALVVGNAVIAKPAEQTPLIAAEAVKIFHSAGIPADVLQLLPGRGEVVGAKIVADERINGVMFTGSTDTAKLIQQTLSKRDGAIVPLIAETGGQNVMIVDSSALPEQVVTDVINSSFNSAGQRCSASRVLFLQEDVAPRIIEMLVGAMSELKIGDPAFIETDVGPVIDQDALTMLQQHFANMQNQGKLLYQVPTADLPKGYYFAPAAFELNHLNVLKREVFGPILHVIRYKENELDKVLDQIIQTGYGLTFGIHSRIDATVDYVKKRMPVGNIYVNRNMIGAVVGVQPFGGEGLSGTGPKAGGPHYLSRLCVERAVSINTTAAGGNATLVSLKEDE